MRKNRPSTDSINKPLEDIKRITQRVSALKNREAAVIKKIRTGMVERVFVFIDMVDSTRFKTEHVTEPESWILRVEQFCILVKRYIEDAGGRVVKYIGDEVMGIFDGSSKVEDALNLIGRLKYIEKHLAEITGVATQIKISVDYGKVYLLKYDGHDELDPQGTPVDRCARISKYCNPGTIVCSSAFRESTPYPGSWHELGEFPMKGLGKVKVFQYGEKTIIVENILKIQSPHNGETVENSFTVTGTIGSINLNQRFSAVVYNPLKNQFWIKNMLELDTQLHTWKTVVNIGGGQTEPRIVFIVSTTEEGKVLLESVDKSGAIDITDTARFFNNINVHDVISVTIKKVSPTTS